MGFSARSAGRVAACVLVAVAGAGAVEWDHYRRLIGWHKLTLAPWDRVGLFWLIAAKTLLALLVPLLLATLLDRLRWRRAAGWCFGIGVALIAAWVSLDAPLRAATGNHLHELLAYAADTNAGDYAGDSLHAFRAFAPKLAIWLAGAGTICWLTGWWAGRGRKLQHRRRLLGSAAAWALAGLGVFPAARAVAARDVAARLGAALPFSVGAPAPSDAASAGFLDLIAEFERVQQRDYAAAFDPKRFAQPADFHAKLPAAAKKPNVIVLCLESFRRDALNPVDMPRLSKWAARQGWRWDKHYAGSNSSEMGIFSLLYARNCSPYDALHNAKAPPQLPLTFRNSGYETSFVTSGTLGWQRMNEFINRKTFDHAVTFEEGEFPQRDQQVLERLFVEARRARSAGKPRLLVAFLMSTHFFYDCPPKYVRHKPILEKYTIEDLGNPKLAPLFKNRYRNALGFMDDLLADFIDKLDPEENTIVLTGDHGEGLFDDGVLGHCNLPSEYQHAVPLVVAGPGTAGRPPLRNATRHADLLPTLLHLLAGEPAPVQHCHGRDLLVPANRADELVLMPLRRWEPRHWMLVRGDQRLLVQLRLDQPRVTPAHFVTPKGQPTFEGPTSPAETAEWMRVFRAELDRVTAP